MKRALPFAALFVFPVVAGCGDDERGGNGNENIGPACVNLVQHCPLGYSWSGYVSDEASCEDSFDCVVDFYTGSCQATMEEGVGCLAELTGPEGCAACDAIMASLQDDCAYPFGCF